jgi:hypothetical protein
MVSDSPTNTSATHRHGFSARACPVPRESLTALQRLILPCPRLEFQQQPIRGRVEQSGQSNENEERGTESGSEQRGKRRGARDRNKKSSRQDPRREVGREDRAGASRTDRKERAGPSDPGPEQQRSWDSGGPCPETDLLRFAGINKRRS